MVKYNVDKWDSRETRSGDKCKICKVESGGECLGSVGAGMVEKIRKILEKRCKNYREKIEGDEKKSNLKNT